MDEPKFSEEHKKMAHEPLLPVEKKLIAASISLGLVLLIVFVLLTRG
jgi:hypothetical protein